LDRDGGFVLCAPAIGAAICSKFAADVSAETIAGLEESEAPEVRVELQDCEPLVRVEGADEADSVALAVEEFREAFSASSC
jgi:hypothetical protein